MASMSMITVLALTLLCPPDPPPITAEEFKTLHGSLSPRAAATWEAIPWTVDLLEARDRAVREKKPIFIWAMNGHPLGCV